LSLFINPPILAALLQTIKMKKLRLSSSNLKKTNKQTKKKHNKRDLYCETILCFHSDEQTFSLKICSSSQIKLKPLTSMLFGSETKAVLMRHFSHPYRLAQTVSI